jgi:hypothetical protein
MSGASSVAITVRCNPVRSHHRWVRVDPDERDSEIRDACGAAEHFERPDRITLVDPVVDKDLRVQSHASHRPSVRHPARA